MKNKILFATTALVATASVAAADVTFSGYGRFGVKYTGSLSQSAANAAARAEQDARSLITADNLLSGGLTDVTEITGAEAITLYSLFVDDQNPSNLADVDAIAEADQADAPFTNAYTALAYGKSVAAATLARENAFITALKTFDAAEADALVYNVATGKVSAVATADIPSTATGLNVRALAAVAADNNAVLAAQARLNDNTATAADVTAADIAVATAENVAAELLVSREDAIDLANDAAMIALIEENLLAQRIATDAILSDTLITSRLRMNIDASTESDSGVTFGVRVRLQQSDGANNAFNSARFYAKSGGLELGVGNIYGVIDNMAGLYSGSVGLTGLGYANVVSNFGSLAYSSTGAGSAGTKEAAEVIYTMGDFGFAVATDGTDTEYGVSATMSGWTVALSASDTDTAANAEWVATVGGTIGGVTVGLATAEAVSGDTSTTLSAKFDVAAATTVTAYYNDDEANTRDDKSYGLGFSHGMGGGTSLVGGVASVNDQTIADFGVMFNF